MELWWGVTGTILIGVLFIGALMKAAEPILGGDSGESEEIQETEERTSPAGTSGEYADNSAEWSGDQ